MYQKLLMEKLQPTARSESRLYSYTGLRFSGDGVAWAAIRNIERSTVPSKPNLAPPTINGRLREEIEDLFSRFQCGLISKSYFENSVGLPVKRVKGILRMAY